ncbi:CASP8 and FADD-like apoptosis regulator [Takifugu flavidus]|uniref:CASP8 and FADD-like apoptosis regulator n=1 Tax=Takifugu flavidus TaxID=433684 RepID=A0A5C6PPC5_9TELE|nr:CASP8 and FADD-like apoptosis regulator [Takifugu flavidus]
MDQLQTINQVVEELNSSERTKLLYLCGSFETEHSTESLKELLGHKVLHDDTGQLLLGELMVRLRRFDILRKVCKTTRDEVERTLSSRHFVPKFRVLMANISEDLASDDLNSLKFLLSQVLPREKLEKSKSFLDVVIELEKLDKVSSHSVDLVEECLVGIGRLDLTRKVSAYKKSVAENIPISSSRDQSFQNQLESYRFTSNPRGGCLIIDCVGNDGDLLEQTFKALQFRVVVHKWLGGDQILPAIKETIRQRQYTEGDAFVCCIISRGTSNHLLGTDSCITGLPVDSVSQQFTAKGCPALAGKPKLLFIQRYNVAECQPHNWREHQDEDLETDGFNGHTTVDSIPENADVFWSHCWTDEHQLEEGPHFSAYLKALTDALLKGQRRYGTSMFT